MEGCEMKCVSLSFARKPVSVIGKERFITHKVDPSSRAGDHFCWERQLGETAEKVKQQ